MKELSWKLTGVILLVIYCLFLTLANVVLLYTFISTREFDRGYNLALKHVYYQKNNINPEKLRVHTSDDTD
jgi:hypothetical protein